MSSVRQTQKGEKIQKPQRWRRQVVVPGSCLGESNTAIRPNSVSLLYKETGQACVLWPFFFPVTPLPFLVRHSIRFEINSDTPSFLCQSQSSLSHFAPADFHFLVVVLFSLSFRCGCSKNRRHLGIISIRLFLMPSFVYFVYVYVVFLYGLRRENFLEDKNSK